MKAAYVALFNLIIEHGVHETWRGRRYRYWYPGDGWKYWRMNERHSAKSRLKSCSCRYGHRGCSASRPFPWRTARTRWRRLRLYRYLRRSKNPDLITRTTDQANRRDSSLRWGSPWGKTCTKGFAIGPGERTERLQLSHGKRVRPFLTASAGPSATCST
jgi:hypothetical protein